MSLVRHRDAPVLLLDPDFATADECAALAAIGGDWDRIHALGAAPKHDETGFSWELPRAADPRVEAIAARMEAAIGIEDALGRTLRFRRYSPGEGHVGHLDTYTEGGLTLVATALLVLQGPDAGGATRFPHAQPNPVEVRAVTGRLVVWGNHRPDGSVDEASFHEGLRVEVGQKVTLTLFVYAADACTKLPG